jgi:hypothetical protein
MTVNIISKADITYFFNKIDYLEAYKYGFRGKYYYTKVMPLIDIDVFTNKKNSENNKLIPTLQKELIPILQKELIPTLQREENILYFGIIRPVKGFYNALQLGKLLYENNDKRKIIIVGKFEDDNPLIKRWILKLNTDIVDEYLNVNEKYKNNIEIYKNPTNNILFKQVNRCQFAYKTDGKGFCNNSSSLINILNFRCILITKSTIFTPDIFLPGHTYYGSVIFQKDISKNVINNKIPTPQYVYHFIKNMNTNLKERILDKINIVLEEYFNGNIIVEQFIRDLISST